MLEKNAKNLTKIDGFFQNNEKLEKQWEHSDTTWSYCGGEGWESVEKNYPRNFETAWNGALAFMAKHGITDEDIAKFDW